MTDVGSHAPAGDRAARLDALLRTWDLTAVGAPVTRSGLLVLAVTRADAQLELTLGRAGEPTALAARALRQWTGGGAPLLMSALPSAGGLLTERPGEESLAAWWSDQAGEVIAALARRLHQPPLPGAPRVVPGLRDLLGHPAAELVPRRLHRQAVSVLAQLDRGDEVLLHGNLSSAAIRETPGGTGAEPRWLAVDPDPATGPAALDLYPFVREEPTDTAGLRWAVRNRIEIACGGMDPDETRGWLLVRGCAEAVASAAAKDRAALSGLVPLLKALAG